MLSHRHCEKLLAHYVSSVCTQLPSLKFLSDLLGILYNLTYNPMATA